MDLVKQRHGIDGFKSLQSPKFLADEINKLVNGEGNRRNKTGPDLFGKTFS
ncbi:MAG: hypothetical protein WAO55_00180 [Candidatus Manganitrophaceae bacterium]